MEGPVVPWRIMVELGRDAAQWEIQCGMGGGGGVADAEGDRDLVRHDGRPGRRSPHSAARRPQLPPPHDGDQAAGSVVFL